MLNIFVSRYESRPTDALFAPADRYVYRIPMPQSLHSSFESRCIGAERNVYSRTYLNPSLKTPEGRYVYSNAESPHTQSPSGATGVSSIWLFLMGVEYENSPYRF